MEGTKLLRTIEMKVADIKFKEEFYPRKKPNSKLIAQYVDALKGGQTLPPADIDEEGNILLDGYHRMKATEEVGFNKMFVNIIALNGLSRLLYAASCNSRHGDRLLGGEKEDVAREVVMERIRNNQPPQVEEIATYLGVSGRTVYDWVGDILEKAKRRRDAQLWWLGLMGWAQREIGVKLGIDNTTVGEIWGKIEEFQKSLKSQASRGRSPLQIAEHEEVSVNLVDAILARDKEDKEVFDYFKVNLQPYDVWRFSACDARFGGEYPGRIPGQLLLHVLYFYTDRGEMVLDPMAGSGTTIDACVYMGRKVYGYDADPKREDIIVHNLKDGWPDRVKKASLVFWDPRYFTKKAEDYGDQSISRFDRKDYLEFFDSSAAALKSTCKGRLVFLCSDSNEEDKPEENIFFWDYVRIFERRNWRPIRRIQAPLETQQVHPDIVVDFRKKKRLARLGRDLVVLDHG